MAAASSLPVPRSPISRTGRSTAAARESRSVNARNASERPIASSTRKRALPGKKGHKNQSKAYSAIPGNFNHTVLFPLLRVAREGGRPCSRGGAVGKRRIGGRSAAGVERARSHGWPKRASGEAQGRPPDRPPDSDSPTRLRHATCISSVHQPTRKESRGPSSACSDVRDRNTASHHHRSVTVAI